MNSTQRREAILTALTEAQTPLSATALAGLLSVSRQIIVGDVALLRASGTAIVATARGYILDRPTGIRYTAACRHTGDQMRRELELMVDHGCTVEDVVVEHGVYGQLSGRLDLSSRLDVDEFMEKVSACGDGPLSCLTGGIHLHTLRCPDEKALARLLDALRGEGMLVE